MERDVTLVELFDLHPVLAQACTELNLTPLKYWTEPESNHPGPTPSWMPDEKALERLMPWEKGIAPDVESLLYWPTLRFLWSVVDSTYYAVLVA